MEKGRLKNKTIVISGGTKGVGSAAAQEFAKEGAKIVIGGRDEEAALKIIRLIEIYGSEAIFVHTDLEKVEDCKKLFKEAYYKYGRIDGFFNYAGITPISSLDKCSKEIFDLVFNVNCRAAFFCCQEAIKYMRLNGGGSIVLTGSLHAWGGEKDRAAYACSKGALLTLMEHIAHNYASEQIRCNYLTMGWVATEGEISLRKEQGINERELREQVGQVVAMGRMQEKYDYMEALIYLMSDESQMMTGSTLKITGGLFI